MRPCVSCAADSLAIFDCSLYHANARWEMDPMYILGSTHVVRSLIGILTVEKYAWLFLSSMLVADGIVVR